MCGFIFRKSSLPIGPTGYLQHRGPDEQTYFSTGEIEFEFSRLTITGNLDGKVPVFSEDRKWLVAFNGEIYNFRKLIESYELPLTNSDTKVLANGLQKFGLDFLFHIRGMFAGIIIDTVSDEIYFFRDPLGEKPLFYASDSKNLVVASEFATLVKVLNRPLMLNPHAVADYFRFGYVQEPITFDQEIFSIMRGSVMRLENGLKLKKIRSLVGYDSNEIQSSLPDLLTVLNSEVTFSTVPTGLALSAGIDSTSLLYSMSKLRDANFTPLIVNTETEQISLEAKVAFDNSEKLGISPHLINLNYGTRIENELLKLASLNDQPHADPSGLSYLTLFKEARNLGLKVVILGHGPDEIFWGYPWFNNRLKKTQRKIMARKLRDRIYWNTPSKSSRLLASLIHKNTSTIPFCNDEHFSSPNPWKRFRAEIVHLYLSSNALRQSDRLAMSSSVEPRTPYADTRLYGWAQNNSLQDFTSFDKSEFRNSVELGVLSQTRYRKKIGFESPMALWFRQNTLKNLTGDCLNLVIQENLEWKFKPQLRLLSSSESYKIIMLGAWLDNIAKL